MTSAHRKSTSALKVKSADTSNVTSPITFLYFIVIYERQVLSIGRYRSFPLTTTNLSETFFPSTLLQKHKKTSCNSLTSVSISNAFQPVWDLWWTKWHWDRFIFDYFGSVSIILPVIQYVIIQSYTTITIQS
jgi:hypothetical protein